MEGVEGSEREVLKIRSNKIIQRDEGILDILVIGRGIESDERILFSVIIV
jgi:hypothetical protein